MTACTDTSTLPTDVDAQFAKGGGGITVTGADPDNAPQGVTIDIRVIGSGFDESSKVEFLLAGKSTPKILTNSTTFTFNPADNTHTLTANITIAADADVALYDIEVRAARGRKGIGSELFGVKSNGGGGGGPSGPIEIVSLTVEVFDGEGQGMTDVATLDAAITLARADDEFLCVLGTPELAEQACTSPEDFFGCPDNTQPCSRILFTFSGGSDSDNIGFGVAHSVQGCIEDGIEGGCVHDPLLANSWRAASSSEWYQPSLLIGDVKGTPALTDNADGTRTLTVYWQGQRGQRRVWSDTNVVWSRYPDLDPVGVTDYFVFRAYSGITTFRACTFPDACWTEYRGNTGTQAYVILDNIRVLETTRGRGKKNTNTTIEFEIQAFTQLLEGRNYTDEDVVAWNLESWAEVMLIDASGKQMLALRSIGINPDDLAKPEIYKSEYRVTLSESDCYEVHLLAVFIGDVDHLEYVWYPAGDLDALRTFKVHLVDGGEPILTEGETCGFSVS